MSEIYIYRIRPVRAGMLTDGPTADEGAAVSAHFAYLQDLTKRGVVFLAGRTLSMPPDSFGIVIFRADTEAAARQVMEGDPVVRLNVMSADLFPFSLALLNKSVVADA
jgi:uncharacterized protein YciI